MRSHSLRWGGLFMVLFASTVHAQTSDDASTRRALIDRAFESSRQSNHLEALRLAEQAAAIQMSTSLRMFIAEEHEYLSQAPDGGDHLVAAALHAATCIRDATADEALNNRSVILRRCTEIFERLNPRLGRLRVVVEGAVPVGLRVRVGERELPRERWGSIEVRVPGEVTIEAMSREQGVQRRVVRIAAGSTEVVTFQYNAAAPVVSRTASAPTVPIQLSPQPSEERRWFTPTRIAGVTILGLGVVSLGVSAWQWSVGNEQSSLSLNGEGVSGAAWARYDNTINADRRLSVSDVCDRARSEAATNPDAAQAASLCDDNATTKALVYGFGIGGLALAGAGVVLMLLPARTAPQRASVAPLLSPNVRGACVSVSF